MYSALIMAQYLGYDWCVTINAPKNEGVRANEEEAFMILCKAYTGMLASDEFSYVVVKGEFVSNYHLQGFVQFREERNRKDVIQYFREISGLECTVAKRLGTPEQAAIYCKKPETSWELFPCKERGKLNEVDRHKTAAVRKSVKKRECMHKWSIIPLDDDEQITTCLHCGIEEFGESFTAYCRRKGLDDWNLY